MAEYLVLLQVQHLGRKMHLAFFPCRVGQAGRMTQELFRTSVGDLVSRHCKVSLAAPRDGARWHTLVFRHHKISVGLPDATVRDWNAPGARFKTGVRFNMVLIVRCFGFVCCL